jgi:hypothetical protein
MKRLIWLFLASVALLIATRASAQSNPPAPPKDPYKNFVGQWSGRILVNHDKMPATVKITVNEEKNGKGMRWDYIFGKQGEKGYQLATKIIVLKPAEGKMLMYFKGSPQRWFLTVNLDRFAQDGFGQFSGSDCSTMGSCRVCIIDLKPTSLAYLWKSTPDGKTFDIYSEFVLTRDIDPNQTSLDSSATSN